MPTRARILLAGLLFLGLAQPALGGQNAGAVCRLTWGKNYSSTRHDILLADSEDSPPETALVTVRGLQDIRGADVELLVQQSGRYYFGSFVEQSPYLPDCWQFQSGSPCPSHELDLSGGFGFIGSAFTGVPGLDVGDAGSMYLGTGTQFTPFNGLWFMRAQAMGTAGLARDPSVRYALARFIFAVIPGNTCPGSSGLNSAAPILIKPSLRLFDGNNHGQVVAVFGGDSTSDLIPFEFLYEAVTANEANVFAIRALTWGRLRRLFR